MRFIIYLLLLISSISQSTSFAQGTAGELSVIVFQSGKPVENMLINVGDDIVQLTDKFGSAHIIIPSGIHILSVSEKDYIITEMELLTIADENTQIIVSIPEKGKEPDIQLETSITSTSPQTNQSTQSTVNAGKGRLIGKIQSLENQKPLNNAQVYVSGTQLDIISDENGSFDVEIPVGIYSLSVILSGYATETIDNIEITKDSSTEKTIELSPAGLELSEFVVLAPYIEGSVASIVQETRDSAEVKEVLGAEQMSQAGDSSAAGALQRVTGLTIEDGKYVVIRGQPSRYTLSLLNNSPLPSPDPIRRIVPLDLFPTDVLSGIEIQKSYSADKPGSFGGGLINLSTRGVPEEPFASISIGTAFNSQSTFKDGLTYEGGSTDFLGKDDGTRELPGPVKDFIDSGESLNDLPDDEVKALGQQFNNIYQVENQTLYPDQSMSANGGTLYNTRHGDYGILASVSWGRKNRIIKELERDLSLGAKNQVNVQSEYNKTRTDMDINLGGLVVLSGKWNKHSLTSNSFFIRNTTMRTQLKEGENNTSDSRYEKSYLLDWNQRELFVEQLVGKHEFSLFDVDWRLLTAKGNREAPDKRTYTYARTDDGNFIFYEESGGQRRFNSVEDKVNSIGADFTFPINDTEKFKSSIKAGFSYYKQDRNSDTSRIRFEPENNIDITLQNPEDILSPDNIGNGLGFSNDTQSSDDYLGTAKIDGQFVMADFEYTNVFRINAGVRRESADFEVKTFSKTSRGTDAIFGKFKEQDFLPASSATWFINKDMQLRIAYGKTVSRPVLVELSETLFFDPDTNEAYIGNPNLKPAVIDGIDTRWEWYFSTEELVSLGGFWRNYEKPIEKNFVPVAGGGQSTTFENAKSASVFGLEIGGRLDLSRFYESVYLQSNLTFMTSSVKLGSSGVATNTSRPLQGQADYLINIQLGYDGESHDLGLAFNRVGSRLDKAGVQGLPDIYREPSNSLNLKYTWQLNDQWKFKLVGVNLLNPEFKYTGGGVVQRSLRKGIDVKATLTWDY